MTRLHARRTQLAIALSLLGAAMPSHGATGADRAPASTQAAAAEASETSIRSILGLAVEHAPVARRAPPEQAVPPSASRPRSAAPAAKVRGGDDRRLDARILGLDKGPVDRTMTTELHGGQPLRDVAQAEQQRIRVVLGLPSETLADGRRGPFEEPEKRLAARAPTREGGDRPSTLARRSVKGSANTPSKSPSSVEPVAADTSPGGTADTQEPMAVFAEGADRETDDILALLQERDRRRPPERRRDEPSPVIADAAFVGHRRGDSTLATSLLLPPDELETLDQVLTVRLRGRFRFDPVATSDAAAVPAPTDDPLLALLDALSARGPDARHAPIIYVAPNPEDAARTADSGAVFRHLTATLEQLPAHDAVADAPPPVATSDAVVAAAPAPLPFDGTASIAVAPPSADVPIVDAVAQATVTAEIPVATAPAPDAIRANDGRAVRSVRTTKLTLAVNNAARLLPVDPFTWDGEDTIDLFASLADHPLLVASRIDGGARPRSPVEERVVSTTPARSSIPTDDEGPLLWAAMPAADGGTPHHVDIFDAEVALPYTAATASSDKVAAAAPSFATALPRLAPVVLPATLPSQPLLARAASVSLPDATDRRRALDGDVIVQTIEPTSASKVASADRGPEAAPLARSEPIEVPTTLALQQLLPRVPSMPAAPVASAKLADSDLIFRAFEARRAIEERDTAVAATKLPRLPELANPTTLPRQPLLARQATPALLDPASFGRQAEVGLVVDETVRAIQPAVFTAEAPVTFEADDDRMKALKGDLVAVADTKLDTMRGGFETDMGLKISFGIERAVYINGNLVTSTALTVADLSRLTAGQVQSAALDRTTLGVIQSGPNNTFNPGQLGASSVATVIQNTLNDQKIQGITQINATVNSLDLVGRTNIQQNIQNALQSSIRH